MYTHFPPHIVHNECYLVFIFLMVCSKKKKKRSFDSDGSDDTLPRRSTLMVFLYAFQDVAKSPL